MRSRERRIDGKYSGGERERGVAAALVSLSGGFQARCTWSARRHCALIVTTHLSGQILIRLTMGPSMSAKMADPSTYLMTSLVS